MLWTTPSAQQKRQSPKASCRAAVWRCSRQFPRLRCWTHRAAATRERACRSSSAHSRLRLQIAEKSAVDGGVVVSKMQEAQGNVEFDAARELYVDLFEAGIVDRTKVVRVAVENAITVASVLLLTEAVMTEKSES